MQPVTMLCMTLSTKELLDIQNAIFSKLKLNESKFTAIREKDLSLIEKWQEFVQTLLPIQFEVIKKYNIESNQLGLSRFNDEYSRNTTESGPLLELNKQKWLFLFDKTFGVTEFKEISLKEARSLISSITKEMLSEHFLIKVDYIITALGLNASVIEKRKALLTVLLPLHTSVMSKFGFEGKNGYIQAQRAIMDYYYDPEISQNASYAQAVLFKRAKIY